MSATTPCPTGTTRYKRAFSTLGCVEFSLEEIRDLACRHGIQSIELRGFDDSIDVPARLAAKYGTPADAAAGFAALGLRVCALDTSLRLIGCTENDRRAFLEFVPWAEALGVKRLRVFDGGKDASDEEIAEAVATLEWWNELRRKNGWQVDLMTETHDTLISTPRILRFLERAPTGTAILWDASHTWRMGGENPADTWRQIQSAVVHIHVKDSISVPRGSRPFSYVVCGAGEFPIGPLVDALGQHGFDGVVSLEWERKWNPELPPLAIALTAADTVRWW